jgi:hypothetical protein
MCFNLAPLTTTLRTSRPLFDPTPSATTHRKSRVVPLATRAKPRAFVAWGETK